MMQAMNALAVIDACVLFSAPVRDLLLNMADVKLFQPKWSIMIQDEWLRSLMKHRSDLSEMNLRKTILAMDRAFPDANIDTFENIIETLKLPDKNDHHVLAAAIKSNSSYIITYNIKDFPPESLKEFNVRPIHPDVFINEIMLVDEKAVITAFINQVNRLKNPPLSQENVLVIMEKCNLKLSVKRIRKAVADA